MTISTLRIATRKSQLALWQAEHVRTRLLGLQSGLNIELVPITTEGDRILDRPLAKIGGKGLFLKELQLALLDNRADIAVHSMKDVPVDGVAGLEISAILERADPRDVLVSRKYNELSALPAGARVGTSSLRRKSQFAVLRADLQVADLRGNVPTRIKQMEDGNYDAILLAAAGMDRLALSDKISARLNTEEMLPAVGQGAIGIECRGDDVETKDLIAPLNHQASAACVNAERAFSRELQGSCEIPIAAHASISDGILSLSGLVASIDGQEIIRDSHAGPEIDAAHIGRCLGEKLVAQGADKLIQRAYEQNA